MSDNVRFWPDLETFLDDLRKDNPAVDPNALDLSGLADVRKIVLGKLGDESTLQGLTAITAWPQNLRRLHLWNARDLVALPDAWPATLLTLDLRGATQLAAIPELPLALEWLDLGACGLDGLPQFDQPGESALQHVFLDSCANLSDGDLVLLLNDLPRGKSSRLRELNLSKTTVSKLPPLPRSLEKLVLRDCRFLKRLPPDLEEFRSLRHLDLRACKALSSLPKMSFEKLQYVALWGAAERLPFGDVILGAADYGESEDDNVAEWIRLQQEEGGDLAALARCKLLILGDGRVGKTCLRKRLVWETLSTVERCRRPEEEPRDNEPSTHPIAFVDWEAQVSVSETTIKHLKQIECLREGAESSAHIHIWDFGGQEIFHNTHRLFAGAGSVFVIVWTDEEVSGDECPEGVDERDWQALQVRRPLSYWLDYVKAASVEYGQPQVAVVCRCTPGHQPSEARLRQSLGRHVGDYDEKKLNVFWLDSLDKQVGATQDFKDLRTWLEAALGAEVERAGMVRGAWLASLIDTLRADLGRPGHDKILDRDNWQERLCQHLERFDKSLTDRQMAEVTGFLHRIGILFRMPDTEGWILLDQKWALEGIYTILRHHEADDPFWRIQWGNGRFDQDDVREELSLVDPPYNEAEADQIVRFMIACELCVERAPTHPAFGSRSRRLIALDPQLLPAWEEVEGAVESDWKSTNGEQWTFLLPSETGFSAAQFRTLMAHVGREWGRRAMFWRNGFVVHAEPTRTGGGGKEYAFRGRWKPLATGSYKGRIKLWIRAGAGVIDEVRRELNGLLRDAALPMLTSDEKGLEAGREREAGIVAADKRRAKQAYDVAISVSGVDVELGEEIDRELEKGNHIHCFIYKDKTKNPDENTWPEVLDAINGAPIVLHIVSRAYMSPTREDKYGKKCCNEYVMTELAHSILSAEEAATSRAQLEEDGVLVKAPERNTGDLIFLGVCFTREDLRDQTPSRLKAMSDRFDEMAEGKATSQEENQPMPPREKTRAKIQAETFRQAGTVFSSVLPKLVRNTNFVDHDPEDTDFGVVVKLVKKRVDALKPN